MTGEWDGRWRNQVGSAMDLRTVDGVLQGDYHTSVGRPDSATAFPLVGVVNGDMIAFTVTFGEHGSVTAWAGRRTAEGRIETLWHLVRNKDDSGAPLPTWCSTLAGAAVFERVTP